MRRFLIRDEEKTVIEGIVFSDGFIVIHGSFFHGVHISSLDELTRLLSPSEIEWIDKE